MISAFIYETEYALKLKNASSTCLKILYNSPIDSEYVFVASFTTDQVQKYEKKSGRYYFLRTSIFIAIFFVKSFWRNDI